MLFERTCDFIRVANLGSVDVKVRFSKVLNDPITVRPGTMVELPIQTNKMFYVSASVAGISADIEVMGFSE
jgi:hypothetical protein